MKNLMVLFVGLFLCASSAEAVVVHWFAETGSLLDGAASVQLVYSSTGNLFDNTGSLVADPVGGIDYAAGYPGGTWPEWGVGDDVTDNTARTAGGYYVLLLNADQSQYNAAYIAYDNTSFVETGGSTDSPDYDATADLAAGHFSGWQAVPEPSSMVLLAMGAAVMALKRRRCAA